MSSTGRSDVRKPSDFYETPDWCVKAIAPTFHKLLRGYYTGVIQGFRVVEPGAGTGNIILSLLRHMEGLTVWDFAGEHGPIWRINAVEKDIPTYEKLRHRLYREHGLNPSHTFVTFEDFLDHKPHHPIGCSGFNQRRYDMAIGNPPYSLAQEFVEHAMSIADSVWFLLRIDFLGSKKRGPWYRDGITPDIYVLEKRPSFTGDGKTDSNNYAWFNWYGKQTKGKVRVLEC